MTAYKANKNLALVYRSLFRTQTVQSKWLNSILMPVSVMGKKNQGRRYIGILGQERCASFYNGDFLLISDLMKV